MYQSESINELAAALSAAQTELRNAIKDADNPYFKSKYVDLAGLWDTIRGPLTSQGLAVSQTTTTSAEGHPVIVTTLMHKSGQWIKGELMMRPVKNDPQAVGSAITYARRYALQSIIGVAAEEDDDANRASGREVKKGKEQQLETAVDKPAVDQKAKQLLDNCKTLEELADAWKVLTPKQRSTAGAYKDSLKAKLSGEAEY